jgi:ribonuclease P protein component
VSPATSQRLRRGDRLRDRRDFQRASREGRRANSRSFVLLAAPSRALDTTAQRIGVTASRRVGGAVVRNLVKRRVREWFRRNRSSVPTGVDLVVIARPAAAGLTQLGTDRELGAAAGRLRADEASR